MPQPKEEQYTKTQESTDPRTGINTHGHKARLKAGGKSILERQRPYPETPPREKGPRRRCLPNSPQEDSSAASEQIDLGSTIQLAEDTEQTETKVGATSVQAYQAGGMWVVEKSGLDYDCNFSVDQDDIDNLPIAELNEVAKQASQDAVVSRLIGPTALKGLDLNAWNDDLNLLSAQDGVRAHFNEDGGLINHPKTEQKSFQFAATITSVLTEKANLECLLQGYCFNAFVCTIAELLPQLGAFADMIDEESGLKKLGTKSIWSLLMWIVEMAVTVDPGVVPLYWWSEAGLVALEELDKFA